MKQVCLFTATGAENLGDELITLCEIQQFLAADKDVRITVFSHSIERTRRFLMSGNCPLENISLVEYFPNAFRRYPLKNLALFWKTLREIRKSDHVYIGGGGLLYSKKDEGHSPLRLWWLRARLVKFFRKPLTYLSLGISTNALELQPYGKGIFSGSTVTVRDMQSQEIVKQLGFASEILPDPVFTYLPEKKRDDSKRIIGIALRKGTIPDAVIIQIIKKLLSQGYEILLLPHSLHPTDEAAHDGYYLQNFLLPGVMTAQTIEQTLEGYGRCHIILSMRLHSMILAIDHGIPFVGISYGKKTSSLLTNTGWQYAFTDGSLTPENIIGAIGDIEGNYGQLSSGLEKIAENFRNTYQISLSSILGR